MITNDPSPLSYGTAPESEILPEQNLTPPPAVAPNAWLELLKAFIAWVGSVILLLVVPLILVLPYFIYLFSKSGAPTAEALTQDKTFILLSIVGVIPAHLLTLVLAWALVTRWGRISFWRTLGFSWPDSVSPVKGFAVCFLIAVALLGMGVLVTHFLGGGKTDLDKLIESSFQARVATAFLAVATAPLVEEIIYRGMLYPALKRLIGLGGAIAIVSIMFAGVHVYQYKNNIGVILVITILSVTLTLIRAFSDRLLPSVMVHLVFNGLQSLYLILQPFIEKPEKVEPAPALFLICRAIHHLF